MIQCRYPDNGSLLNLRTPTQRDSIRPLINALRGVHSDNLFHALSRSSLDLRSSFVLKLGFHIILTIARIVKRKGPAILCDPCDPSRNALHNVTQHGGQQRQILVHLHVNKTNSHVKGFALGLALKQRRKAARKSSIEV